MILNHWSAMSSMISSCCFRYSIKPSNSLSLWPCWSTNIPIFKGLANDSYFFGDTCTGFKYSKAKINPNFYSTTIH
jgi:hypothetical protein